MFPQEGHPVLTEGRVDLPQMQVWMVAILARNSDFDLIDPWSDLLGE